MSEPRVELILGDCLDAMRRLTDGSIDAVVTDPPAGIAFMSKEFDDPRKYQSAKAKIRDRFLDFLTPRLAECLRVARPGSILLCWAIPRTSHWTGTAIEDAGWIIEDRIAHHFGSGFPKHKSKLKPATEDWWLARKSGGAKWLNVDGCRVAGTVQTGAGSVGFGSRDDGYELGTGRQYQSSGRWPANLVLSHSPDCNGTCADDCPIRLMGEQGGTRRSGKASAGGHCRNQPPGQGTYGNGKGLWTEAGDAGQLYGDSGSAARFFPNFDADPFLYCPKASRKDRGEGNRHPTVKPTALMRWLCKLATPPGGTVLDPFMGSGSTGRAALDEGFGFIGIERDPEYMAIAEARVASARSEHPLFATA